VTRLSRGPAYSPELAVIIDSLGYSLGTAAILPLL
jgi:hypothetical protein